jgi:hypothetical protein
VRPAVTYRRALAPSCELSTPWQAKTVIDKRSATKVSNISPSPWGVLTSRNAPTPNGSQRSDLSLDSAAEQRMTSKWLKAAHFIQQSLLLLC